MQQYLYSLSPIAHIIFFTGVFVGDIMATGKIQPCHLGNARNTMGLTRTPCMFGPLSVWHPICSSPKKEGEVPPKTEFFKPGRRRIDSKILTHKALESKKNPSKHTSSNQISKTSWLGLSTFQPFNPHWGSPSSHTVEGLRSTSATNEGAEASVGSSCEAKPFGIRSIVWIPFPLLPFSLSLLLMVEICLKSTSTIVYGEIAKYLTFQVVLFGISEPSTVSTQNSPSLYS